MSLVRWEPFSAMDEMFNRFPSVLGRWPRFAADTESKFDWAPSVDISETGEEYLIRAALPAVKKEDVKVTVDDGMLTLSGERRQKEAAIRAESKDGVLTIHVPKTRVESKKPTTIKVQ